MTPAAPDSFAAHDSASFAAGQDCGTRAAACVARFAALELIGGSRWWNRGRRRLMADVLLAQAEDLESAADADRPAVPSRPPPAMLRPEPRR